MEIGVNIPFKYTSHFIMQEWLFPKLNIIYSQKKN
jgi:hypothetical protein